MKTLKRKRIQTELGNLIAYPLSIVNAPYGYGKTTEIERFMQEGKHKNIWLTIYENDEETAFLDELNYGLKSYIHNMDEVIDRLSFFNETEVLSDLQNLDAKLQHPLFIVVDNYAYGFSYTLNLLLHASTKLDLHRIRFVMITEELVNEQNKDILQMSQALHLNIDYFRIQQQELHTILVNEQIKVSHNEEMQLLDYTEGWISLISLCLQSYMECQNFYNESSFDSLMNTAFYNRLTTKAKEGITLISVLPSFTMEQARYICQNNDAIVAIISMSKNHFLVNKINRKEYRLAPVLVSFLKQKIYISEFDITSVYNRAAEWFISKKQPLNAISLYLESNIFKEIIFLMMRYNESFMDKDQDLILDVFNRMPMELKYQYPYVYLQYICDNMTNVDVYRGKMLLDNFKKDLEQKKYQGDYSQLLGEYYFIHAFSKYNDAYAMMQDFHLAYDAFQGGTSQFAYTSMVATFGAFHMLYLYHKEIGGLKKLVQMICKEVRCFIHISHGVNAGSEYQIPAEMAFETGEFRKVKMLTEAAYGEAISKKQYSICVCTLFLRARLFLLYKNEQELSRFMSDLHNMKQKSDNPIVHKEIECALAYLYILSDKEDDCADWLKKENYSDSLLLHETAMISYLIKAMYQLKKANYETVLTFCDILTSAYDQQEHVFGSIYNKIFQAIAYSKLNNPQKAKKVFQEALSLAKKDHLVTIFLEFHESLNVLLSSSKDAFVQEVQKYFSIIQRKGGVRGAISKLSKREQEIAMLMVKNMTVKKIAQENNISINTVQAHTKQIYKKLNINSKYELMKIFQ